MSVTECSEGAARRGILVPHKLIISLPHTHGEESEAVTPTAGHQHRASWIVQYVYKFRQLPAQPQKLDIHLPSTAVHSHARAAGRLGELCFTRGIPGVSFASRPSLTIKFTADTSSSEDPAYLSRPPRMVSVTKSLPKHEYVEQLSENEWTVSTSTFESSGTWKLEFKFEFESSCCLGFKGDSLQNDGFTNPVLKASLLKTANVTGDLNVLCKEGSKIPAHSAVLAGVPYFASRLKADWSGTGCNLNNPLDLQMPNPLSREVLEIFLKFVYGDTESLRQLDPTDASTMQDLVSTAEACGVLSLCSAVDLVAQITPDSAHSWLEWLSHERGGDTASLREKVKKVVKDSFTTAALWDALEVDELLALEKIAKKPAKLSKPMGVL